MRVLVLDDEPARHALFAEIFRGHDITKAFSEEIALVALDSPRDPPFDVVSLDHDLGADSFGNGPRVARFIAMMPRDRRPRQVLVHSANPVAAATMLDTLLRADIEAQRVDPLRMARQ